MANLIRFSGDGIELTGNATAGNVASGKTFYNTNPDNQITGTLALSGDAGTGNVASGKTFYNNDLYTKRTGTLALSGNAGTGDVASGKTFYNNDLYTKRTGTLALSGNAGTGDVRSGKTFYSNSLYSKQTGTATHIMENSVGVTLLSEWSEEEHQHDYSYTARSNGILVAFMYSFATGGWGITSSGSGRKDFVNRLLEGTSWTGCKTVIRKMQNGDTFSCHCGAGDGRYGQGGQVFWIAGF